MNALLKSAIRSTVHTTLGPMEARLLARHPELLHPPIFILGPPRSGTSLFYELLVTRYDLAFFSNLAHRFWRTPAAVSKLGASIIRSRTPRFESDYGHIVGWSAPNEGGWIWQRWLQEGDWSDERKAPELPVPEMRATLGAIEAVLGAPFVNKNVMHANRIRLLDALFPGCLFLEVCRDPVETARSIIRAERKEKGPTKHPDDWWSVRPSTATPGDVVQRAVTQVRGVTDDIARDTEHLRRDCLHKVEYTTLCAKPTQSLEAVAAFLRRHRLPVRERAAIPLQFSLAAPSMLEPEDEHRLQALLHD